MVRRKNLIICLLLCLCVCLAPFGAQAATVSEVVKPVIPETECSLTVSYRCEDTAFSGVEVKLYKIADVSANYKYTLTQSFELYGVAINNIQTSGEWKVIRTTLETHIIANKINPTAVAQTDPNGQAVFASLSTGLYLVVPGQTVQDDLHCEFESALISLPESGQDGNWQYHVTVNAKGEMLPPIEPDEKTEYRVLKLWKGDEGRNDRPESIEIEIFRDGESYSTATLSNENDWSYSWSVEDDTSSWAVTELTPEGYVMSVEKRETTFVITNTFVPTEPQPPVKPPQTGDTSNLLVYVLIMTACGLMLIILGAARKRNSV